MFEPGNKVGVQFSSEYQPETQGRPPGVKNRATIARKVLEMSALLPEEAIEKLKKIHPELTNKLTTEEIATIMIAGNAMRGDVKSYEALMNSAYGAPKQEIENHNINTQIMNLDPLADATTDDSTTENI